tara:strand:- start:811 stop:972 length:162 start_codon:yes stop_codon:yes gene_type:complete
MSDKDKVPMTPEEEDKNADVVRDENGKVKPQTTEDQYNQFDSFDSRWSEAQFT